ncbi:MAG: hypothetical protein H7061_03315 [Bdellovibrionaceae bacterium]|nr:hypothetical protein [Bdellovibrio sp.]
MKLKRLLQHHEAHRGSHVLVDNLGDGLLCQENKIYGRIRLAALKAGYQFSAENNNFYEALPLSQLETILTKKIIPYTDNVTVLKQIEKTHPNVSDWQDIGMHLKRNYVFHESCHAVARSVAPVQMTQSEQLRVLQMLLEESFANTCELLAVCDAGETAHQIFYEINSYSFLFEERAHLSSLLKNMNPKLVTLVLLLTYLFSNYLFDEIDDSTLKRVIKIAQSKSDATLSVAQLKSLRQTVKLCFTLDESFKLVTTSFYLRLNGIKTDTRRHLDFDFLKYFESEKNLQDYLRTLVNFI